MKHEHKLLWSCIWFADPYELVCGFWYSEGFLLHYLLLVTRTAMYPAFKYTSSTCYLLYTHGLSHFSHFMHDEWFIWSPLVLPVPPLLLHTGDMWQSKSLLSYLDKASYLTAFCAWGSSFHLPVTLVQLMMPSIGWTCPAQSETLHNNYRPGCL